MPKLRDTMSATAPEEKKIDTATRILLAADKLFCDRGFDGVSMRDVAEEADVNKALVFYHHNSKEELFEKVLDRYYAAHRGMLESAAQEPGSAREKFHHVIDVYLDFIQGNTHYARLVMGILSGNSRHLHLIQRAHGPLLGWTRSILGEVAPDEGALAARHFFITISAAVVNYFTYTPAVESVWGEDPFSEDAIEERREHLHWIIDACLDQLVRQASEHTPET
jgi:AcrR family transcriptional regulator